MVKHKVDSIQKEHVKGWSMIRPPLSTSLFQLYTTSQLRPGMWDDDTPGSVLTCHHPVPQVIAGK